MARTGRPPKTDVERRACSRPGHSKRPVVLNGLKRDADGNATHQRFRCNPGKKSTHTFYVPIAAPAKAPEPAAEADTVRRLAPVKPAIQEVCREHPGGRITLAGSHPNGKGKRQR